jgi:hypothetical protein
MLEAVDAMQIAGRWLLAVNDAILDRGSADTIDARSCEPIAGGWLIRLRRNYWRTPAKREDYYIGDVPALIVDSETGQLYCCPPSKPVETTVENWLAGKRPRPCDPIKPREIGLLPDHE